MQWSYHITYLSTITIDAMAKLNKLGDNGWELVTVDEDNIGYFKRPRQHHL